MRPPKARNTSKMPARVGFKPVRRVDTFEPGTSSAAASTKAAAVMSPGKSTSNPRIDNGSAGGCRLTMEPAVRTGIPSSLISRSVWSRDTTGSKITVGPEANKPANSSAPLA